MKKLALLLLASFLLSSCFFAKGRIANHLTVESKAIPPEFGNDDTYIVCILTGNNSRDKYMISAFDERYHGNHVFLDRTRLKYDGYENIEKYRYVLDFHHYTSSMVDTDGSLRTGGISEYYIHDRKTNKDYNAKYRSGFFGKYLKAYAEELEKKRFAAQ